MAFDAPTTAVRVSIHYFLEYMSELCQHSVLQIPYIAYDFQSNNEGIIRVTTLTVTNSKKQSWPELK